MTAGRQLIAVDIGNSSTKVGWFDLSVPLATAASALPAPSVEIHFRTPEPPPELIIAHLSSEPSIWRVASVHRERQRVLEAWVRAQRPQDDFRILNHRDLPLVVEVDFPERVGLDRLAAAVAANALRDAERPAIVIDAGSAVTVDLVSGDGSFQGGVILPGFRMQAESLSVGADLLPLALLQPTAEPPEVVGKNTEAAIRSGLFWGTVGAVREIIERTTASLSQPPHIFVTGGDLRQLAPLVSRDARFVPHMVLAGIRLACNV